ncbi:hypothetical protein RHSIM_Rhsim05G0127400 [Rhododendron simsii]|uniref:Uncharacterized protein n=1 Tax=Rhododendron simsii TaxID=118357 RepID=A0A834GZL5_RHOSS|nr:hypothetical protein RHSIM_Rhsim05G0127400 [Rhododendron simsii]
MDALIPEVEEHAEEEHEEEDPEEEEPEEEDPEEWENEEEPEVQVNAWLNDHGMAEQVQVEIEAIPEEEPKPESNVEELWDHLLFEDSSAWYDWFFRCVYHYRNDDGAEKQEEFSKSSSEAHDDAEQKASCTTISLLHLFELNGEIHEDSELQSLLPPGPPRRGGLCKNSGNPRAKVEGPLER